MVTHSKSAKHPPPRQPSARNHPLYPTWRIQLGHGCFLSLRPLQSVVAVLSPFDPLLDDQTKGLLLHLHLVGRFCEVIGGRISPEWLKKGDFYAGLRPKGRSVNLGVGCL